MISRLTLSDTIPRIVLGAIASTTIILLISIFFYVFSTGIKTFERISLQEFFFGPQWNPTSYGEPSWGILSLVVGTIMISFLSLLIAIPFGLAIAIYLSELASPRVKELLKPLIEMIASIPSVVLGLLGIIFLAPMIATLFGISNGLNALTTSLLVAIAALPTIASICEDAISSVNKNYKQASFALGATHWQTISHVIIPAAKSGILAGLMLGLGRVIGETMIVLMVAGNSRAFPASLLHPVSPMTATIAIDIKEVVVGSLHWDSLFAIASLLFMLTFVINLFADFLIQRHQHL